jgi:hypothetical protein
VALVQAFERGYRTGVFVMPSPPPPPDEDTDRPRKKKRTDADRRSTRQVAETREPARSPKPSPTTSAPRPSPKPTPTETPSPTPTKTPSPTPTGPVIVTLSGTLQSCAGGWCVSGTTLDLGPGRVDLQATQDYDGSGVVGTNAEELDGLVSKAVTVQVEKGTGILYVLNGRDYRLADGSFA